jgi:sterol desaturase/sphingolipid hydroxylase (fatty acid hydroxylase superfamily)
MLVAGMNEAVLRFGVFAGLLVALALAEALWPRRIRLIARARRWSTNLGIATISALLMRSLSALVVPIAAVATAVAAERAGIGLLNAVALPGWLELVLTLVLLDFAIWVQHWASHHVPLLWRLHAMHHSDRDFDVTTALRFHPVEIALSMLYKMLWVAALGPTAVAVVLFEVALNGFALFNHANLALPAWIDRPLRLLVVTPDMHRIHHSIDRREHDTNFGFNLSIWDRLFGTYTEAPAAGQLGMTVGLPAWQDAQPAELRWSLTLPFRRWRSGPSIDRSSDEQ